MKKGIAYVVAEMLLIVMGFFIIITLNTDLKYKLFPMFKKINRDYNYLETMSFSALDASYNNSMLVVTNSGYTNLTNITVYLDYKKVGFFPGPLSPGNVTVFNISAANGTFYVFSSQGARATLSISK